MTFGPRLADLLPGAHNAVETCLAIQPGERVALIADEASRDVAASLEQALADARRRRAVPPDRIGRDAADAVAPRRSPRRARATRTPGSCACSRRKGSCRARMAIVGVVERRRIRYAHMVGVTPRIMREGMRADYRQVDRLSQQLCERMDHARIADRADRRRHRLHARRSIPRSPG